MVASTPSSNDTPAAGPSGPSGPSPPTTQPVANLALLALAGAYDGLDARLCEVDSDWSIGDLKITGRFVYLAFRNGQPTVDEFAQFLFGQSLAFCIPRREREAKRALYEKDKNERHFVELYQKARRLFVHAAKSQKTVGEPAELTLFMLMEALLKAPQ